MGYFVIVEFYDWIVDFYFGCVGYGSLYQIISSLCGFLVVGKGLVEIVGVVF